MPAEHLSRRDLLMKCAALGALTFAPGATMADALAWGDPQANSARAPTPWDEIGPFYKRDAPHVGATARSGRSGPSALRGRTGVRHARRRARRRHYRDLAGE